ncbi:hypothetical protein SGGMMB4_05594 [Sodalis glossinidius str. 'morsitans']|uniref:Uncharacterized protein n=1 Tax=Sodalis glossinidius (strain morsitans) TaxID=343509 RepID=A0A193QNQ2_SODGM|nr:hypothetical protein SGGMMB4_05594 [Sodalis glossinidius str. 'morsitans']
MLATIIEEIQLTDRPVSPKLILALLLVRLWKPNMIRRSRIAIVRCLIASCMPASWTIFDLSRRHALSPAVRRNAHKATRDRHRRLRRTVSRPYQ